MANKQTPDFSLVIACYNEAEHLESSVATLISTLDQTQYSYELIFIDDKSRDNTTEILKKLEKQYEHFQFFYHTENVGRGGTVAEGIKKAISPIVGFIDIDLEVSPIYIAQFIDALKNSNTDVALGRRYYPFKMFPPNYLLREVLSRGYVVFTQKYLKHPINDTESGYKFFKKDAIMPLVEKIQDKKWFWDTEIVIRSYLHGLTITEIPVLFLRRDDKTSTVNIIPDTLAFLKAARKFYKTLETQYGTAPGLLYRFPQAYTAIMKHLFGRVYPQRYRVIKKLISDNTSVVDICAGDAVLFDHLQNKHISYLGMDISLPFVRRGLKRGVKMRLANIEADPFPEADYLVMQGSLFQFKKRKEIIEKLIKSAKRGVIISESVHNLEKSSFFNPFAKILMPTIVGTHHDQHFRYTPETFKEDLKQYHPKFYSIPNNRDLVAFIQK